MASNLRTVNGDLCIVPHVGATGGGETAVAHGTIGAETESWAYLGRFGGHFKDFDGSPTSSDYFGRTIEEVNVAVVDDTCYDDAIAAGYTGANGIVDFSGANPGNGAWTVQEIDGSWGACSDSASLDSIGFLRPTVELYLSTLSSPKVPSPVCGAYWGQRMRMVCRDFSSGADWKELYVDYYRTAGASAYWNGSGTKVSWGWRGTLSTVAGRAWGASESCSD